MPDPAGPPLLSVIVPVFDRAATVAAAIAGVAAAGADAGAWELVVVDDGSSDGSAEAARAAVAAAGLQRRARVVAQANAGPGPARNRGAALARGTYLAFLDSDDLWLPWTLPVLLEVLAAEKDPALVFLQGVDVPAPARPPAGPPGRLALERHPRFLEAVAKTPAIRFASCNAVVRAEVFRALGGFTAAVRCSEDTDFFLRADRSGHCLLVRAPVMMAHATGGASLSGDAACVARGFRFMLEAERAGRYPGGPGGEPLRTALLAGSAVYASRTAFAAGHPGLGYRLALGHARLILKGGKGRWLPRLALTPLLGLVRPRSYPFRLRPGAGSRRIPS